MGENANDIVPKVLLDGWYCYMKNEKFEDCKTRAAFIDYIFPCLEKDIARTETYNKMKKDDFSALRTYIGQESFLDQHNNKTRKEITKEKLEKLVENCINSGQLSNMKESIIDLLKITDVHEKSLCEKLINAFKKLTPISEINRLVNREAIKAWVNHLYYFVYFAVTEKLYEDLAFSEYPYLDKDLDEYNNKITMMYGSSGDPGMFQLYKIANREKPNIIALYECGEHEYYGTGPSRKVNYEKAYSYYEKTRECNDIHPLATWSIAFMRFSYTSNVNKPTMYRIQVLEEEIKDGKKKHSWYDTIIQHVGTSYHYRCSAAANLIGRILDCSDDEFPICCRGIFKNKSSKEFYKESAEGGYVFGCNNYAVLCEKEAEKTDKLEEKIELMKESAKYLKKSAELGEPWASNRYGLNCYNGMEINNEIIYEKNEEEAYGKFVYSLIMMNTKNYYWPIINLIKYFWLNENSFKFMEKSYIEMLEMLSDSINSASDQKQINELQSLIFRIEVLQKEGGAN